MREMAGVLFWDAVGLVTLFCFYASVLANLPLYLLLIPIALALFGVWFFRLSSSGAFLVIFGGYPALLISVAVLGQIANSDWSCSEVAFDGIGNPNGGASGCTTISIDLIMTALVFWAMALLGAALLYSRTQRDRTCPGTRELRSQCSEGCYGPPPGDRWSSVVDNGRDGAAATIAAGAGGASPERFARLLPGRRRRQGPLQQLWGRHHAQSSDVEYRMTLRLQLVGFRSFRHAYTERKR